MLTSQYVVRQLVYYALCSTVQTEAMEHAYNVLLKIQESNISPLPRRNYPAWSEKIMPAWPVIAAMVAAA